MNAKELAVTPEDQVRAKLQSLARHIAEQLPKGFGFCLLVASMGEGGTMLYCSSVERTDAIQMMREWIANQMEERNWQREMPLLESEEEFESWWQGQQKRPFIDLKQSCRDAFLAGRSSA